MTGRIFLAKGMTLALNAVLLLAYLHFLLIIGAATVMKKMYDWAELHRVKR